MGKEQVKVNISSTTKSQSPSLGLTSRVFFTIQLIHEEFMGDNLISRKGSSLLPHQKSPLSLKFTDFTPNHVFQILNFSLHDHFLSQKLCDHIVPEAQRFLSQTSTPTTKLPLTMEVNAEIIQKVVYHLPPTMTTKTDSGSELEKLEKETCPICLEDLSSSDSRYESPICQLPYCDHFFHEVCVIEWLEHGKNSCPLLLCSLIVANFINVYSLLSFTAVESKTMIKPILRDDNYTLYGKDMNSHAKRLL